MILFKFLFFQPLLFNFSSTAKSLSALQQGNEPGELVERRQRELNDSLLSKENITKKIQLLEAELQRKQKERNWVESGTW